MAKPAKRARVAKQSRAAASARDRQQDQSEQEDLRKAQAEADRRIAVRDRAVARSKNLAVIAQVTCAAPRIFAPLPGASDSERAALEHRRHHFEDLLAEAILAMPRLIDPQAIEARGAERIPITDEDGVITDPAGLQSVVYKAARPNESVPDVVARVLVERGYSENRAVALAHNFSSSREANDSAARRTLARSLAKERERQQMRPEELPFWREAEIRTTLAAAEPEICARRERQVKKRADAQLAKKE
jgi:hypothetical protein